MVHSKSHLNYDEWEVEDALVKSWLINSMTDHLMSHFMQCRTVKEVRDAVKRSYLDASYLEIFSAKSGGPTTYKIL